MTNLNLAQTAVIFSSGILDKVLPRIIHFYHKELLLKRERAQINKIRNERGEIAVATAEIQRIIREYCEQLYTKKLDSIEKKDSKKTRNERQVTTNTT